MKNSVTLIEASGILNDVRQAKKGSTEAFCRIIETNKNQLYRIAKGIVYSESDIEDVLQEVTLKAWLKIGSLKRNEYFKTWLIRILINECNSILNKRKKVIPLDEIQLVEYDYSSPDEKIDLWNALRSLSVELRTSVVLFYYEGLPYSDIAKILNVSEGTVKSRLSRAKTKLEKKLNITAEGE